MDVMRRVVLSAILLLSAAVSAVAQNISGRWIPLDGSEYVIEFANGDSFTAVKGRYEAHYRYCVQEGVLSLTHSNGAHVARMRVELKGEGDSRILEVKDHRDYAGVYRLARREEAAQDSPEPVVPTKHTGARYSLADRFCTQPSKPTLNSRQEGMVVVRIWVDREGSVIKTEAPENGSTITHPFMVEKSKEAAMKVRFNPAPKAPEHQVGTITYVFSN